MQSRLQTMPYKQSARQSWGGGEEEEQSRKAVGGGGIGAGPDKDSWTGEHVTKCLHAGLDPSS